MHSMIFLWTVQMFVILLLFQGTPWRLGLASHRLIPEWLEMERFCPIVTPDLRLDSGRQAQTVLQQ